MEAYYYLGAAVLVLILFIIQSIRYRKQREERLDQKIRKNWGNRPEREYSYEEFENLTHYHTNKKDGSWAVDDITWNDLDMDSIYMLLNNTYSSVGEEYLYHLLRTPVDDPEKLAKRDRLITYFEENKEDAFQLQKLFAALGHTKKISFYEYFIRLVELGHRSSTKSYISLACFLASVGVLLVNPMVGIIVLLAVMAYNIVSYYRIKAEVENYFICVKFIVGLMSTAQEVSKVNLPALETYNTSLKDQVKQLGSISRGISLIISNNMSGNLADVLLDYIRMMTHVDLIKFNSMLEVIIQKIDVIEGIYETLGLLEASIATASFRNTLPMWCRPQLDPNIQGLTAQELYHPMIQDPVTNGISEERCVLLTGSNASGKSTFLKTVAINAILAQSVNTCAAKLYQSPCYRIYSSMALRDDLMGSESYFIVEIKSLKRILDRVEQGEQVLCFVDEVLRGTNTVERIAASSRILKDLSDRGAMCFAATHDVELTQILEKYYTNYHFQEQVLDDDVKFDYVLYKGSATSRNAIKLLGVMGYERKLVADSEQAANEFLENGTWKPM